MLQVSDSMVKPDDIILVIMTGKEMTPNKVTATVQNICIEGCSVVIMILPSYSLVIAQRYL